MSAVTTVLTTTDDVPELADVLARRAAQGLDTYDEWWEGVYRIVGAPSPEHGRPILQLGAFLLRLADAVGLFVAGPINVGQDKEDAKVPDIGVYRPDTPRTSTAYLSTAELVVEILSPRERPGEKLDFYAAWNVREYLEIDLPHQTLRLLARRGTQWEPVEASNVVPFRITGDTLTGAQDSYRIAWPTP